MMEAWELLLDKENKVDIGKIYSFHFFGCLELNNFKQKEMDLHISLCLIKLMASLSIRQTNQSTSANTMGTESESSSDYNGQKKPIPDFRHQLEAESPPSWECQFEEELNSTSYLVTSSLLSYRSSVSLKDCEITGDIQPQKSISNLFPIFCEGNG